MRMESLYYREQPCGRSSRLFAPYRPVTDRFSDHSNKDHRNSIPQIDFFQLVLHRVFKRLKDFFFNLPMGKALIKYKVSYETAPEQIKVRYDRDRIEYYISHTRRLMIIEKTYKGELKRTKLNQLNTQTQDYLASTDRFEREAIETVKKYPYWPMFILFT